MIDLSTLADTAAPAADAPGSCDVDWDSGVLPRMPSQTRTQSRGTGGPRDNTSTTFMEDLNYTLGEVDENMDIAIEMIGEYKGGDDNSETSGDGGGDDCNDQSHASNAPTPPARYAWVLCPTRATATSRVR